MQNNNPFARYSRQMLVAQLGDSGQAQIAKAKVLIVGAGGLGCTVVAQLAGAGVGELHIADYDSVELSNLHRQILFREADIGQPKAEVASKEANRVNKQCISKAYLKRVSLSNVETLCTDMDVIVDAADNFATSYLLSDFCKAHNKILVSASVNRTFGYIGQFCFNAPSLRAVFPRLPKQAQSCDTVGVTGPSVGMIASLQAQEVLKAILDDPAQLRGKLLYTDAWDYKFQEIDFNDAKEPGQDTANLLKAGELNPTDWVIDVRTPEEVEKSPMSYDQLLCIELESIASNTDKLPLNARLVCACLSGQRALIAAQQLKDHGFEKVAVLIPD